MGQYSITTFGKWEPQRKNLVANLIAVPAIISLTNEEQINHVLLTSVASTLIDTTRSYVINHMPSPPANMKKITIEAWVEGLGTVGKSLEEGLKIDPSLLAPWVAEFTAACRRAIPDFVDDIMIIGGISQQAKFEALKKLYGSHFQETFPELITGVILEDKQLIAIACQKILVTVEPRQFGKNEALIREELKFIIELAPQVGNDPDFSRTFQARTGMTMEEFKNQVAQQLGSPLLWKQAAATDSVEVKAVVERKIQ